MKTFAVFAVLFAVCWAGPAEDVAQAIGACIQEKHLDANEIKNLLKEAVIAEDNDNLVTFFECYWTKVGVLKNGNVDFDHAKIMIPLLIKQKVPQVPDVEKVGNDAVEHCKSIEHVQPVGLYAIKLRNCAINYAKSKVN